MATIIPLLLASGAGALCWWRLRHSSEQLLIIALEQLQETYLHYTIYAAKHERQVAELFRILRSAGVEPILLKGWATGRLYPEAGLRPSGDIDLCASAEQYEVAQAVLNRPENQRYWVDLDTMKLHGSTGEASKTCTAAQSWSSSMTLKYGS